MKYGLDFGTTNTSIAIKTESGGKVLPIDLSAIDPSVARTILYFLRKEEKTDPQKFLIGQAAVERSIEENKFRKPGVIEKIYTGRMVVPGQGADPVPEFYNQVDYGVGRLVQSIKSALKVSSYRGTSIFDKFYSLEDLIATFIGEIKRLADVYTAQEVTDLVVGRPVYFSTDSNEDYAAQLRLENALKQVGFKNISFVFEPVAAAEQFISTNAKKGQLIFIFDFGGGTLDTAVVEVKDTKLQSGSTRSKVLTSDGVYVGGDLLNADIVKAKLWPYFGYEAKWSDQQLPMPQYIYESLAAWYNIAGLNNPEVMESLRGIKYQNTDSDALERLIYLIQANVGFDMYEAVEKAKKELSSVEKTQIVFSSGPIDINLSITKKEFDDIIKERVKNIKDVVLRTLERVKVTPEQIDIVVKTGGSSLIPAIEDMLQQIFEKQKIKQFETFTSIASGLALSD